MERFSAWARWIAVSVFTLVIIPLAVEFLKHMAERVGLYDQPGEAVDTILNFFLTLAELPWLRIIALILFAFVAGLWLDWLLRKLDDTRANERTALGMSMMLLARDLAELKHPMLQAGPAIKSRFASARKLGIWAPGDRVFSLYPNHANDLVMDYLMHVGQMLRDGNFREAKREAKDREAAFSSAYAYQQRNKSFKAIP